MLQNWNFQHTEASASATCIAIAARENSNTETMWNMYVSSQHDGEEAIDVSEASVGGRHHQLDHFFYTLDKTIHVPY